MTAVPPREEANPALGEFRFRSGVLVAGIGCFGLIALVGVAFAVCFLVGEGSSLRPWGWLFPVGAVVFCSIWPVIFILTWVNCLLRISEEGVYSRDIFGRGRFVAWPQIVALHTGKGGWNNWVIRYRREGDGKVRSLGLPALAYSKIDVSAALDTVRSKACLTREVQSFWQCSWWGPGREREEAA